MLVDLRNVPPEGLSLDQTVEASLLDFGDRDCRLESAVRVQGRLAAVDEGAYRLHGRLSTMVGLDCVRCLEPLTIDLREELDLVYLPQASNLAQADEEDRGLSADEMAVAFYQDEQIDLRHMVWEQIELALPMKPLCKENCRGLCPSCGVNRNDSHCECKTDELDPRWAGLKALL